MFNVPKKIPLGNPLLPTFFFGIRIYYAQVFLISISMCSKCLFLSLSPFYRALLYSTSNLHNMLPAATQQQQPFPAFELKLKRFERTENGERKISNLIVARGG
jgi:hypothetical protein